LIPTPSYVTPVALMIGSPSWYGPTVTRSFMTNGEWYDAAVMSKR
jgi:rare lipoprotein A (peptidoglycan hydrolase)